MQIEEELIKTKKMKSMALLAALVIVNMIIVMAVLSWRL